MPTNKTIVFRGDKMPVVQPGEQFVSMLIPRSRDQYKNATSRSDGFTVKVNLNFDPESYDCYMIEIANKNENYRGRVMDDHTVTVDGVQPGDNYILAPFDNLLKIKGMPAGIYVYKKINVTGDMTVTLDVAEAKNILRFCQTLPDGKEPVLPVVPLFNSMDASDYDYTDATAREVGAITFLYNEEIGPVAIMHANQLSTSADGIRTDSWLDIAISDLDNDWHIAHTHYIVDRDNNYYLAHTGVSGTSTELTVMSPEYTKWNYEFANNPIQSIIGDDGYPYGVRPGLIWDGSLWPGMETFRQGVIPQIYLSEPKGFDNELFTSNYGVILDRVEIKREIKTEWGDQTDIRTISSPIVVWDKDIQGPAFANGGAGVYGSNIYMNIDNKAPGAPGNPAFAAAAENMSMPLGMSAPVMVNTCTSYKMEEYFSLYMSPFYIGQYGEERGADGALSTVYFNIQGEDEITVDYDDFLDKLNDLSMSGKLSRPFSVEFVNDRNILIEDIEGYNNTVISYADPSEGNVYGPTATMLQFRNTNGDVTNVFDNPGEGYVTLSGGDFNLKPHGDAFYWECSPVTLKVEYATRSGEEWKEIVMNEYPDKFMMPSFGYFWRGSLTDVKGLTRDGWYKLRISMTDIDGNSQVQTIYPAFCIKKFAGIDEINPEHTNNNVEYFNMQGQRVVNPAVGQILIRRNGDNVRKIIIR